MAKKLNPALKSIMPYWVEKLRLQEWKITVRQATEKELEGCLAYVNYAATVKTADVALRRLDNIDQGLEEDLVHELLHLVFIQATAALEGKALPDHLTLEFGLNVVAENLVTLRRRSRNEKA